MVASLRLPFTFAPERLVGDLEHIRPDEWVPHFNDRIYEGEWSGVALRSVGGKPATLYPDPTAIGAYADTEMLERCPYYRDVLASLQCPFTAVRLLRLKAGSNIREHRDYKLGYEDGEVRLHVPIVTSPDVTFYLDGLPVPMNAGECWYVNVNLPHRVDNRSRTDRIHLVLDCVVNDWLAAFFPGERPESSRLATDAIPSSS